MTTTNHKQNNNHQLKINPFYLPFSAPFSTIPRYPFRFRDATSSRRDVAASGVRFGRVSDVTSQNLATAQVPRSSPLWLPPPWAECAGLHERSCLPGRAPGASERWRDLWCWRCCSRPSCALVMDAGRRRGSGPGPTGTERRRLTVVPTGRVPAVRAGPGIGSAPSVVSLGLRSGVVRFRDPSGWAGT